MLLPVWLWNHIMLSTLFLLVNIQERTTCKNDLSYEDTMTITMIIQLVVNLLHRNNFYQQFWISRMTNYSYRLYTIVQQKNYIHTIWNSWFTHSHPKACKSHWRKGEEKEEAIHPPRSMNVRAKDNAYQHIRNLENNSGGLTLPPCIVITLFFVITKRLNRAYLNHITWTYSTQQSGTPWAKRAANFQSVKPTRRATPNENDETTGLLLLILVPSISMILFLRWRVWLPIVRAGKAGNEPATRENGCGDIRKFHFRNLEERNGENVHNPGQWIVVQSIFIGHHERGGGEEWRLVIHTIGVE